MKKKTEKENRKPSIHVTKESTHIEGNPIDISMMFMALVKSIIEVEEDLMKKKELGGVLLSSCLHSACEMIGSHIQKEKCEIVETVLKTVSGLVKQKKSKR